MNFCPFWKDPAIVYEGLINTKFTSTEVKNLGWTIYPIDTNTATGLETTNYAHYDCAGFSYGMGYLYTT